jgi:hypothetical protein
MAVVVIAVVAAFAIALRRSTELFVVAVVGGQVRHLRGRVPAALWRDMCDVLQDPSIERGTVKAVLDGGRPRIVVNGSISEVHAQQLRNVVGRFTAQQIRSGRPPKG